MSKIKLPADNTLALLETLEQLTIPELKGVDKVKPIIHRMILNQEREILRSTGMTMDDDRTTREQAFIYLLDNLIQGAQYAQKARMTSVAKDMLKMAVILEDMRIRL